MDEQKKTFPQPGDYFAIYPLTERVIKEPDNEKENKEILIKEYNKSVYQCIDSSNATRIVCREIPLKYGTWNPDKFILARCDWRFDDINDLKTVLGID